ncbi:MAG: ribonuclease III [Desulfovibrionaceae bacterium]|nr:ribonuclease III [Desulfovibrionaceae bacterium]
MEKLVAKENSETQIANLEAALNYHFKDRTLLEQALTHSSFANENGTLEHNERLEFLGDAVLELSVSQALFLQFKDLREGDLTKKRSQLVSSLSLAQVAKKIGVQKLLKLGRGEELQGGRQRDSILSDALEAVLAAVYLDGGFVAAKETVITLFAKQWSSSQAEAHKDYKTLLQELAQRTFKATPTYAQLTATGPDHAKVFTVELTLPNGQCFTADGTSYKRAEQAAARVALETLNAEC